MQVRSIGRHFRHLRDQTNRTFRRITRVSSGLSSCEPAVEFIVATAPVGRRFGVLYSRYGRRDLS